METFMILSWLAYLIRQTALAGTALAVLFLLAEILAPGSVLPFFNLHALIIGTLALHGLVIALPSGEGQGMAARMAVAVPLSLGLVAAAWFALWGAGTSAALLALAVSIIVLGFGCAIVKRPSS